MWNSLDLQCPVDDLVSYPSSDHSTMENLRDFVTVLTTAADTLTSDNSLWNEMKVLKNIQAKYKRILQCDRFLIYLYRVGHCLKKMVLLNLSKSYLDLAERFLCGFQDISGNAHLPSRQQIEYVLIRTLSASRLVCEAIAYSRESFCFLIQKLKVGHLILDLIITISVVARVNILLRATLEQLSSIYKQVLFWRYKVKKGEYQWAKKFDFPQDVEEWIKTSEPAYLKPLSMSAEDIDRVKSMLSQMNGLADKMETSDTESVVFVDEVTSNSSNPNFNIETDFGDVVPRIIKENDTKPSQVEKMLNLQIIEEYDSLTSPQKNLLQKIIDVQSLKHLEDLWKKMQGLSHETFPGTLTKKKTQNINKLFTEIKAAYSRVKYNKMYVEKPKFLENAILKVCKILGFTDEQIKRFKKDFEPDSSEEIQMLDISRPLAPVKSVKKLKVLYNQLKEMLEFKNEPQKLKSLETIFNSRLADIRHLKRKGKTELAKKLTSCTSKEFLALYQ